MYANLLNGTLVKYPYQWGDFMTDNNNTQGLNPSELLAIFPLTDIAKQGYSVVEVQSTAQPAFNAITQDCTEGTPTLANGVWSQTWVVTTATAAEQAQRLAAAWQAYQSQAQVALNKSDNTVKRVLEGISLGTCAATNADVQAYMQYRKALRTILSQPQPSIIPALPVEPPYPQGT